MKLYEVPLSECHFDYARSSGAGGQNVNKVNSKVILRWSYKKSKLPQWLLKRFADLHSSWINKESEVVVSSQRFREQGRNFADCVSKLNHGLQKAAIIPKTRVATKPRASAVKERLKEKSHRSTIKQGRSKKNYHED